MVPFIPRPAAPPLVLTPLVLQRQEPAAWKTLQQLHPVIQGECRMRAAPHHLGALAGAHLVRIPCTGL